MDKGSNKNSVYDAVSGGKTKLVQAKLTKHLGGTYASFLGINLASMEAEEVFKWLIASVLLGSRVSERIALKTYKELETAGVLSVEAILATGKRGLVRIMSRGGYARHALAAKIEYATVALKEKYDGDLNRLHFFARDGRDLEKKLLDLGKGIRPTTVTIFLRELRYLWDKADPPLSQAAFLAATKLGLTQAVDREECLNQFHMVWDTNEDGSKISDAEISLIRLAKNYCHMERCSVCPMKEFCISTN